MIGQKFFRVPDRLEDRIQDVYRVLDEKEQDRYRCLYLNSKDNTSIIKSVPRSLKNEEGYKIAPYHYKITIKHVTMIDGAEDVILYLSDTDIAVPIYAVSVLRSGMNMVPIYIHANMADSYDRYMDVYNQFHDGVTLVNYEYSFIGYIDDSIDNMISFISLDQTLLNIFYNTICNNIDREFFGTKTEVIKTFLEEYGRYSDAFRQLFGIYKFPFSLEGKTELNAGDRFMVEAAVQDHLIDYIIVQYYIDIDLNRIQNKFSFIEDKSGRLFILNFIGKSELDGLL